MSDAGQQVAPPQRRDAPGSRRPISAHQNSAGISLPERSTWASPTAIATPNKPRYSPVNPISHHATAVSTGHGASTTRSGANKNPVPTYQAEPARSASITRRSQVGIGASVGMAASLLGHPFGGDDPQPVIGAAPCRVGVGEPGDELGHPQRLDDAEAVAGQHRAHPVGGESEPVGLTAAGHPARPAPRPAPAAGASRRIASGVV